MPGGILFRMILWDLARVFLVSLIGITGILLMAGLIAEASQQGLGPAQILSAIPLLVPSTLPYTIPATTLFACCVVYGRLSADGEILAIQAAGLHLGRVVAPGLVLGVVMSACTMALYFHIIPATHHLLRSMVLSDAEELLYSLLRRHGMIAHPQLPYAMFVKGVEGKKLINPVFKRKNAQGQIDIVAHAREAELRVDLARGLLYIHMRVGVALHREEARGDTDESPRAYFDDKKFDVILPSNFLKNDMVRPREMTWLELGTRRAEVCANLAAAEAELEQLNSSQTHAALAYPAREKVKFYAGQVRQIDVEYLMRPALSLGCLCFILVGCPVGIWFSKGDYLSAFITCFLPIVIVYYPLMLCGTNLAKEGRFHQPTLVFAADALIGIAGVLLFRRLLRN